ncbi:disulfide isomerase DsbC N-terminal domain-containing protein, partial [Enterobacter hormaechei]|uniref:disulfide isomerase DsbC N-terminal domain-containing protein n=1 Tax=Enterobacter hormaechei TaxID=158836 RepID=UPI001953BFF9
SVRSGFKPQPVLIVSPFALRSLMTGLLAAACLPALANEAVIRKAFAERMPNAPKIDEVRPAPMPGLWEVRIGNELRYT